MSVKEWNFEGEDLNVKSALPDGIWHEEPDFVFWSRDGYDCLIVRMLRTGHLCGYVGIPDDHCLHGEHYDKASEAVDVHGGFTFDGDSRFNEKTGSDKSWWIGFDCAHSGDLIPSWGSSHFDAYRDINYVLRECDAAVSQLKALSHQEGE